MPRTRRVALMLDVDWCYKRHTEIMAGALRYAQSQGWHTVIDEFVDHRLHSQRNQPVPYDGVIARATSELVLRAESLRVPVVNIWRNSSVWDAAPSVFPDFQALGSLVADHLLSRGVSNFSTLTYENDLASEARLKGFAARLGEAGYSCTSAKLPLTGKPLDQWLEIERTIARWMDNWALPIGVYVGYDRDGRIVAQMCRNRGLRVPEDVAIVAGLNEEQYCEGIRPTLSSVDPNYERVGYEAARLLDRLMDGEKPPVGPVLIPPKDLVVRESTDFYFVKDTVLTAALKFIAENAHKDIAQEDVARAMTSSLRALQLRFEKYLKRSITSEIRRVRIERAKRELARKERTIKEIALACGFGEVMRMHETFRRELGMTPGQYRKVRNVEFAAKYEE